MLATRQDITNYIPQRPPMVMIHNLLEANDEIAVTQLQVSPDNIFVDGGKFTEPGMVENIAQTAAVQIGYVCVQRKVPVPIGYIAAIRDLRVLAFPPADALITTLIKVKNQVLDITLVEGEVKFGNEVMCRCEMRIFAKVQS